MELADTTGSDPVPPRDCGFDSRPRDQFQVLSAECWVLRNLVTPFPSEWRNGRRTGLKIRTAAGSTPASGTKNGFWVLGYGIWVLGLGCSNKLSQLFLNPRPQTQSPEPNPQNLPTGVAERQTHGVEGAGSEGSNPSARTSSFSVQRVWCEWPSMRVFQSLGTGSNPVARSNFGDRG